MTTATTDSIVAGRRRRGARIAGLALAATLLGVPGPLAVGPLEDLGPRSASAQTALGDSLGRGDALDSNLSTESRYNDRRRTGRVEFLERNLLVTGNVARGRGFRGSVGYTASRDFRGDLGSDDLFDFRADSILSNPQAFQSPGLVNDRNRMLTRDLGYGIGSVGVLRDSAGSTAGDLMRPPSQSAGAMIVSDNPIRNRLETDRLLARTTPTHDTTRSADGQSAGIVSLEGGGFLSYQASALGGLQPEPLMQNLMVEEFSPLDRVRYGEDLRSGFAPIDLATMYQPSLDEADDRRIGNDPIDSDIGTGAIDERLEGARPIDTAITRDYAEALSTITDRLRRGEDEAEDDARVQSAYERWREMLSTDVEPDDGESEAPTTVVPRERTIPGEGDEGAAGDDEGRIGDDGDDPLFGDDFLDDLGPEQLAELLRHGTVLGVLGGVETDRFNELVDRAETALAEASYLSSERLFERALNFKPGHPTALAGLVHAQLGAGLYPPASANLRILLERSPEMIDARYDDSLLPSRARLDECVRQLRSRIEQRAGLGPDGSSGLLLAYIGHQIGDRAIAAEGLDVFRAGLDPTASIDAGDRTLHGVLRRLWVDQPTRREP